MKWHLSNLLLIISMAIFTIVQVGCATCQKRNGGKATALDRVMVAATGEVVVMNDSPLKEYSRLDMRPPRETNFIAKRICKLESGEYISYFETIPIGIDNLKRGDFVSVNVVNSASIRCLYGKSVSKAEGGILSYRSVSYSDMQFSMNVK